MWEESVWKVEVGSLVFQECHDSSFVFVHLTLKVAELSWERRVFDPWRPFTSPTTRTATDLGCVSPFSGAPLDQITAQQGRRLHPPGCRREIFEPELDMNLTCRIALYHSGACSRENRKIGAVRTRGSGSPVLHRKSLDEKPYKRPRFSYRESLSTSTKTLSYP